MGNAGYDTGEGWVVADDGAHCASQVLADVAGAGVAVLGVEGPFVGLSTADDAPSGLRGQVEPQKIMVALRDLLGDGSVPELLGQPVDLVVEHVGETLEEEEGQQVVLELGGERRLGDRGYSGPVDPHTERTETVCTWRVPEADKRTALGVASCAGALTERTIWTRHDGRPRPSSWPRRGPRA